MTTRFANNAAVVLGDPGDNVSGAVNLTAAVSALPGGGREVRVLLRTRRHHDLEDHLRSDHDVLHQRRLRLGYHRADG